MNLREKIIQRQALIGVIGLGYVGLPLVLRFAEVGFKILGFDSDPRKVELLNRGESYIKHIGAEQIAALVRPEATASFRATAEMSRLDEPDVLLICVPTPLNKNREPDLQFVEHTSRLIGQRLRPGQLISLESTTYPGTTQEVVLPLLQQRYQVGRDFYLVYSPERRIRATNPFPSAPFPRWWAALPRPVSTMASPCIAR